MDEMIQTEAIQRKPLVRTSMKAVSAAVVEGILGIGALAVAIIGLAHVVPMILLAVSSIIVGTALLFQAGALAARYSYHTTESERRRRGWVGAIFFGGTAGVTLGILGVIGFVPLILVPIAAMSLGAALLLSSALNARLNALEVAREREQGYPPELARETMSIAFGAQAFVGLAAMGLGLLALAGVNPLVLALVAMFSIGGAALIDGAIVTRVMSLFAKENREEIFIRHVPEERL
ncbi:MAG: hypothetical protein P8175_17645 [Deltaproteobacteria bacterium]